MRTAKKKELVKKLVELTVRDLVAESDVPPDAGTAFARRMNEKLWQEQIELRLKYFSAKQVKALLDFYSSDMGRSILENQSKIDQEIASSVSIISSVVQTQQVEDGQSELVQRIARVSSEFES